MTYTIKSNKLAKVTRIYNRSTGSNATQQFIESQICYDWPAEQNHQNWIDTSPASEIAEWLQTFIEEAE